jgi:hypothetical protein
MGVDAIRLELAGVHLALSSGNQWVVGSYFALWAASSASTR